MLQGSMSILVSDQPTITASPTVPQLILCADGGGSKVCVVVRSDDGLEVRGTAGPCNVQSVGYASATQSLLLATYRALTQLPRSHVPPDLLMPFIDLSDSSRSSPQLQAVSMLTRDQPPTPPSSVGSKSTTIHHHLPSVVNQLTLPPSSSPSTSHLSPTPISLTHLSPHSTSATPAGKSISTPHTNNPTPRMRLPPLNVPVFQYAWLALAGISCKADEEAFGKVVCGALGLDMERVKVTNDVNLLAAPAIDLPGIDHVIALVAGTGTVGRVIKVGDKKRGLPLEDVAMSRGWGYLLCDEGSAFWIGRLAIRALLSLSDRHASSGIYSTPPPPFLPLHNDLLAYFGTSNPLDLINVASLTASGMAEPTESVGEATSRRNALLAGAARVVFKHAFPGDVSPRSGLPTPPGSADGGAAADMDSDHESASSREQQEDLKHDDALDHASHLEALGLARQAAAPLIWLTLSLLGDRTIVKPERSALTLGGGLMMSEGYREMLLDGLKKEGVNFGRVIVVGDAAGEGAQALGRVEFE
ncbi:hypothetical protein I312_106047 [Cryptococcus bacillisporus CA1280]|uniref:uncharacterized protein n=1 Tax=Cryptococcus bacillisporus CA1280 TaxID=1296109 RepID=UPI0033680A88